MKILEHIEIVKDVVQVVFWIIAGIVPISVL
ncbi:hypothetical protein S225a_07690 [Candidatus Brocadiaceae bacterium S225]|nr:hypothetical protein S225a_07690 [Candidatus Brocadiaceae bacterium S225]